MENAQTEHNSGCIVHIIVPFSSLKYLIFIHRFSQEKSFKVMMCPRLLSLVPPPPPTPTYHLTPPHHLFSDSFDVAEPEAPGRVNHENWDQTAYNARARFEQRGHIPILLGRKCLSTLIYGCQCWMSTWSTSPVLNIRISVLLKHIYTENALPFSLRIFIIIYKTNFKN